jgi:hypothetical protein
MMPVKGSIWAQNGEDTHSSGAVGHILPEDMEPTVNVAFAEAFCLFTRNLGEDGCWYWRHGDGPRVSLEQVPSVFGGDFTLVHSLDEFCTLASANDTEGRILSWALNRKIRTADGAHIYGCTLIAFKDGQLAPLVTTECDDPDGAIAIAMVHARGVSLDEIHRALFPSRYFAASI